MGVAQMLQRDRYTETQGQSSMRSVVSLLLTSSSLILAAESDAVAISANIQARHTPFGTILDPIFSAPDRDDQITGYTRCGDSAIWTGHYLAAEAFRYKVTGSADALANAKAALNGLTLLTDVTGTNLLARCAVPVGSDFASGIAQEEAANGVWFGSANGQAYMWIGNTSRDQYSGVFFGLGVAYDMIDDPDVRNQAATLATRMLQFLTDSLWNVVMPDGSISTTFLIRPDEQLELLQVGRHLNSAKFGSEYSKVASEAPLVPVAVGVDAADASSSYYKFNLDAIGFDHLLPLENSFLRKLFYSAAYDTFRATVSGHQNAHFNMIDRVVHGANKTRDAQTADFLDQWLQRPRRDVAVDLHGVVPVCGDQACDPIPIPLRVPTDFLWQRSPFQLSGGGDGLIESAGIDYILPYWMARYYGVVSQ
jgi:hypothetical protein